MCYPASGNQKRSKRDEGKTSRALQVSVSASRSPLPSRVLSASPCSHWFEYLTKTVPSHAGSVSQEEVSHESESGEKESENREDVLEVIFDWSVPGRPNTNKVLMLSLTSSSAMAGSPPSTTGPMFVRSGHHQSWRRGGPAMHLSKDINPESALRTRVATLPSPSVFPSSR